MSERHYVFRWRWVAHLAARWFTRRGYRVQMYPTHFSNVGYNVWVCR